MREKLGESEPNSKVLLDKIKKNIALLETHISILDDLKKK
tara:strand:- start:746 stop:865 length:120 start_codon:yes stop_codon:yes gene_type:complete